MLIERRLLVDQLARLLASFRAVELVGPRQVGKTTLARHFIDVASPNISTWKTRSRASGWQTP